MKESSRMMFYCKSKPTPYGKQWGVNSNNKKQKRNGNNEDTRKYS